MSLIVQDFIARLAKNGLCQLGRECLQKGPLMPTYAIGDIQGCFDALQKLLEHIQFDPGQDFLWFTGDLVNRGKQSLQTLRFIKSLGDRQQTVLGNHDLHLLAVAAGAHPGWQDDTLRPVLLADDRDELLTWLSHRPLLHYDKRSGYLLVHAGLAPSWDLATAMQLADEVGAVLQGPQANEFFHHMYGNLPDQWTAKLQGWGRLRCITNYFTRARFCHADGRLELNSKGTLAAASADLVPWFQVPHRANQELKIIFGHWAALGGQTFVPNTYALDTGCVWGHTLTAMRLEDEVRLQVPCAKK